MDNILLGKIEYKIEETALGVWRRYLYPGGALFEEFVSHQSLGGLPLLHYTAGKCPETGRRIVARGVVAIGRLAVGMVAIGQASMGVIAIGQLGLGVLFGLGQATSGLLALGQLALGGIVGLGQLATGLVAVGQLALGKYVLAQIGVGQFVWDMHGASPIAEQFFRSLMP
jgi:hypothetical protein